MTVDNDKGKSSNSPGVFGLIFGLLCLVSFLILVLSSDPDTLLGFFDGIPLFMILILGISGLILYPDITKRSKKRKRNDT